MKCEIIRDLLSLYVENLCSDESKDIVAKHLDTCNDCQQHLAYITKDILPPQPSKEEFSKRASEKDLLIKSKQMIQKNLLKKISMIFNTIVIALTILMIIIGFVLMLKGYYIKYPSFRNSPSVNILYFAGFLIILLPIFLGVLKVYRLKKEDNTNHYVRKFVTNILMQIFAVFLGIVITIIMFIAPPLDSQTDDIKNYLNVDKDILNYETVYSAFFPAEISKNAKEVEYYYEKYSSLFNTTARIELFMILPDVEYFTEKDKLIENNDTISIEGENSALEIVLKGVQYPGKAQLEFRYNDDEKTLNYSFYINDSY